MAVPGARRRFTVTEYERMAAVGILTEDDRVELIAGEIIEMSPKGSRHAACVTRLNRLLSRQLGDAALIRVQDPVQLSSMSEPEPDIALVRPRDDDYAAGHPTPAEVLAVMEVAETSRDHDRKVKLPLYAEARIAEVWLVDLVADAIERHTEPQGRRYRRVSRAGRGETLASTVLPALVLPVDAVLG